MRRPMPISMAALRLLVVGSAVPLAAQQGPCDQIIAACTNAGFTVGGVSTGTGLHVDCVVPIMQGIAQPTAAKLPLPQVSPQVVAACKALHPDFGQGRVPTPATATQPANAVQPLATPGSPPASGSVVTSGNGIPAAAGGLSAGAGSVQSGIPNAQGIQSDVKQAPTGVTDGNTVTSGKTVTSGNPSTSAIPSLTAGSAAPQPGALSDGSTKAHGSWLMTCRIGANTSYAYINGGSSSAHILFNGSKGPASSGLEAGQCAFQDRAIEQTEPFQMCFVASVDITFDMIAFGAPTWFSPSAQKNTMESSIANLRVTGEPRVTAIAFSGPGASLLRSAALGPTTLINIWVHLGTDPTLLTSPGSPPECWIIDKYGP